MTSVYVFSSVYVYVNTLRKVNTLKENKILQELKGKFAETIKIPGLRLQNCSDESDSNYYDVVLELSYGNKSIKLMCLIKSIVRTITIEHAIRQLENIPLKGNKYKFCLVVPYLSKKFRALCREKEIAYIDLSGNIFINIPGVLYVEKGGEANKHKELTKQTGLFSDKKSFVIRYLFENPKKYCGVREIASACSINPGGVSTVINALEKMGYITRNSEGKSKLLRWRELLADWASFYKLKKRKEFSFYWHKKSLEQMINVFARRDFLNDPKITLTLHAGAFLVDSHTNYQGLHAYVSTESDIFYWQKELNLAHVKQGGNVFLQVPYYRHSVNYGSKKIDGVHIVSPIQLYLDLINFPVRGEEQAEHILTNIIEPSIEGGK